MSDDPTHPDRHAAARDLFLRAEGLFFEIAPLAPDDREHAIAARCAGDGALEHEVRSLLASADRVGAFLNRPALGRDADAIATESGIPPTSDPLIGAALGPYRVQRRIASGGMGSVYEADRADGAFEQRVAVKVVKRGMDSEEILERFRSERRTLASLDHPNIARLIDAGVTDDGRPFLVMEHVEGVPIDRYCDAKGAKVRERIELFRQVCDAVHHAHQSLVIHRDLKPENILVTPAGVPKLLDFGISKVLTGDGAAQDVTSEEHRRLTPEYASPEQVEGRSVTTGSDIYSLGVVLYELLTGSRPYRLTDRTTNELRRIICETTPPAPSRAVELSARRAGVPATTASKPSPHLAADHPQEPPPHRTRGLSSTRLRATLRGDLDNIVMRALRKEPQRRYLSAEQFSADLGRYLAGLPVQARRDTLPYRASKFIRRHAVGVSLTVAATVTLAAMTVQLSRSADSLRKQRDELIALNHGLEETRRFLTSVISGGDAGRLGPDATLAELLRESIDTMQAASPEDPETRAAAQQALGHAAMTLGMLPEARPLLESALAARQSLDSRADARLDAEIAIAELLFHEGRHADAEAAFRALLSLERTRAAGLSLRGTAREGLVLNNLGAAVRLLGRADEALALQREALCVRQRTHGVNSLEAAESHNNIATALVQSGNAAAAADHFRAALGIREERLRPGHPLIVRCRANLGLALHRMGNSQQAVEMLASSVEQWDTAFGPKHPGRVSAATSLALALRAAHRPLEAVSALEQTLRWQQANQPAAGTGIAATKANIALALIDAGEFGRALALLEEAMPSLEAGGDAVRAVRDAATDALHQLRAATPK